MNLIFHFSFYFSFFRRFTAEIAPKAKSVACVDFMEDFIDKNRKANHHFGNCEFVVADVTKLERPKERYLSLKIVIRNFVLYYIYLVLF